MAGSGLTCRKTLRAVLSFTLILFLYNFCDHGIYAEEEKQNPLDEERLLPTVMIATLVRNKAHTLPWFLGLIENLDYPKDRISLWIRSDHNEDNTTAILKEWLSAMSKSYHHVDVKIDGKVKGYSDEDSPLEWTEKRFATVMKLRQKALEHARKMWADYLFMIDADVTLENYRTLQLLIEQNKFIVGPMLNNSVDGLYSNFWGGMSDKGYYKRSDNYIDIIDREEMGLFSVPMVHTCLLIDMRNPMSRQVSYIKPPPGYQGPRDDIIIFAHTVKALGATMHVLNTEYFGKVMYPLDAKYNLDDEFDHFTFVKLEAMVEEVPPLRSSPHVFIPDIPKSKLGFDEIYMVNLKRRPARRFRMLKAFDYLGIDAKIVDAVDGKDLNDTYLQEMGIKMLPSYSDPYHGRPMKMGEIGCFLSHYHIWEEVVAKNYEKIIVFEDDVRFEAYFERKLARLMNSLKNNFSVWDLVYLGRKRLRKDLEKMVGGSDYLAWPHYSYWTISYVLSNHGARKLLDMKPLGKMVPVDEYLPIMFDRHPEESWKKAFEPRDLIGLSAEPFLVFPTHYTGESNYFSDTEDSTVITDEHIGEKKEAAQKEKIGLSGVSGKDEL